MDFRELEFCKWNGIDYESGGYTSKSFFIDDFLEEEKEIFEFEKFILESYKSNKVIFSNIINFSFLFDDEPSNPDIKRKWSLNRYYGFYVDSLEKVKTIEDNNCVKKFTLYTSAEAYGAKAEYIRHGMDYQIWLDNCHKFLELIPSANFSVMSTYTALSVTSYTEFLKDILIMKLKYHNDKRSISLDIPYLDNPKWMSVRILPMKYKEQIISQIKFMNDNHCDGRGFQDWEADKLERIQYLLKEDREKTYMKDFALFFDEHDKRRNTNFLATFPELANLYAECKDLT